MENNNRYNPIFIKNNYLSGQQRLGFWVGSTESKYCSNCGQFILPNFDKILNQCNSCETKMLISRS